MTYRRRFPMIANHSAALACFADECHHPLAAEPFRDCEYADGEGRYRKTCPTCGKHTYYDLAPAFSQEDK